MINHPFGPKLFGMGAAELLEHYDTQRQKELERKERERRGQSEFDEDLGDTLNMAIVRGIVIARLEGKCPPFAPGDKLRCLMNSSEPDPNLWYYAIWRGDTIHRGEIIEVSDFTYLPNVGWLVSRKSRSDFMFYSVEDFEKVEEAVESASR